MPKALQAQLVEFVEYSGRRRKTACRTCRKSWNCHRHPQQKAKRGRRWLRRSVSRKS